jgi:hypothetical protein
MKKALIVGGAVILLILIGASNFTKQPPQKSPAALPSPTAAPLDPAASKPTMVQTTAEPKNTGYELLSRKDNGSVENISILVPAAAEGEASAKDVKKTCKKMCNIDVYDDKKAYNLNAQYDEMMGRPTTLSSDLTAWKEKNYVFVGDHYVGSIMFEDESYNDYPFRDWYYRELKAK